MTEHYELVELLGKGGFGEVWKARDTRLNRAVAIKRLPESFATDRERRERLHREALAASSLNHPNICTIHDFIESDGEYRLVMEYLEGKTLHDTLANGPLPLHDALSIALQIADALGEAHRHGIIHRDIKSSNIILTPHGRVKVLDFGLARPIASTITEHDETEARLTRSGVTLGTLHYMSPEQLLGGDVDGRSDLFSLGVVLYELLTGRLPFEGSSIIAVSDAILHRHPLPVSSRAQVPKEVHRILERLLAKKREERYQNAEEVIADLSAIVQPASRRRSPLIPWSIAAGIVLLAAALLFPAWQRSRRVKWARETLVPQIAQLIERDRYIEAVHLANTAQSITPDYAPLKALWPKMTMQVTIDSDPPGANVYFAPYNAPEGAWELAGLTPLKDANLPRGTMYRWKFEKQGYATAYRVAPWLLMNLRWSFKAVLDRADALPAGMVRVPAHQFALKIPGLDDLPAVRLGDFFIDQHEVTNEEYKKFVDAGGYRDSAYWKQPFVRDGKPVAFQEAMKTFVDSAGTPGPATWELGDFPKGQGAYPVSGVSWYEAAACAEFAGKRLPTIFHWNGASGSEYAPVIIPASNFAGHGPWATGSHRNMSPYGTWDMAGNVKEWCSNQAEPGNRFILGGASNEPTYMFEDHDAQSPWSRLAVYGFRCIKTTTAVPPDAERAIWIPLRDYSKDKPVSDEVFAAYRSLFEYDKTPLNAVIESRDSKPESWNVQKISFDAAYGNERLIAYLYLPKNWRPPYQTLIFFPGSGAIHMDSVGPTPYRNAEFAPKSGRALLLPIYKSTYERRDALNSDYPAPTAFYRDHVIAWVKDLRRSIDYLETRPDIDTKHLAYLGLSWGAALGPTMCAMEPRLKTAIFVSGGFGFQRSLPEVDTINFAPRMKQPVLLLNARYDHFFPVESSQVPFVRMIGTPDADKKYIVYDTGHAIPRLDVARESLAWLDRYFGPVRR